MAEQESFPIRNIEDMSIMDLGRLALAKSILTDDPQNFVVAVHKLEPFIINDWEEYEKEITIIENNLKRTMNPTSPDYRIKLAVMKYRNLVKRMKKQIPLDVVGIL